MTLVIKEGHHLRLPQLVGCSQVCFLSNHSAGFLDQQNNTKNQLVPMIFKQENNHQRKVTSKIATFRWIWPDVPLIQQAAGFFDEQYLCKKMIS